MAEEEEDYMSDCFLNQAKDIRPGLRTGRQKRKEHSSKTRDPSRVKRVKTEAQDRREEGLATPLSKDNKGFSLLQKMGYKKGMGLGKSGEGRTVPIPVIVKDGKGGLGRQKFVQERQLQRKVTEARNMTDFRRRKQDNLSQRKIEVDLRKSQLACEQLDCKMGISSPAEKWFWPAQIGEEEEEDSEDDDLQPTEMTKALTEYLRSKHFYCIWCGTTYEGARDMEDNCPGDTEEMHE